jgi:hypothetical protein
MNSRFVSGKIGTQITLRQIRKGILLGRCIDLQHSFDYPFPLYSLNHGQKLLHLDITVLGFQRQFRLLKALWLARKTTVDYI